MKPWMYRSVASVNRAGWDLTVAHLAMAYNNPWTAASVCAIVNAKALLTTVCQHAVVMVRAIIRQTRVHATTGQGSTSMAIGEPCVRPSLVLV
ncbi:hypothetical protein DPMN_003902 [Dreissena polymorpha]|uniref:Uncharacterized protein n=1 Tax=Dreissena polymorpha TaxID=45954 RepID=A0A9D4RV56_DREPO|nr:hypothetical protein DPMN_003902 [Dreissena polymorpha]